MSEAKAGQKSETTRSRKEIIEALMQRHGQTFCDKLSIPIEQGTPSPLFRWLVASILFSARINADIACAAARALSEAGWRTAQAMAESTWEERTEVLNRAGYARYDESTSRMLGESAQMLLEQYKGDLRILRETAGAEPQAERKRLKAFKGLGDVGVDIFFREVQTIWDELYPFLDERALDAADQLGLPRDARALAGLVPREDFPRFATALAQAARRHDIDAIRGEEPA
ncbi:MAG: putative EndoIII-related endonuclease [Saliniramus fredricksonii]|uniref:Endonuclease III n=1 Tax=Saliniramus fredricksonii TaxID=1653334 RepID=A0A0P7Y7P4_9HYPH|nr:hypothetical protein [Saliniramus fredricksonii]KPQ10238.1 MAG: putative EndoIII-related endonuclease [Saliniramus fredricksonii]SCC80974.1 Endonuclease III [Saliniramus fredricksonii]